MIVIIPLGGIGSRFKKCGYTKPKPLILVMGKPIIFWLIDSINTKNIDKIVIPYNTIELSKYNFEDIVRKRYPKINIEFVPTDVQTRGAAETVLIGLSHIKSINIIDCPVLIIDGDNFYTCDIIKEWNGDNCVIYIEDDGDSSSYSFLEIENNLITNIVEKNRISNNICVGAYGFKSYECLIKLCNNIIISNRMQKNEFYMSGVVKMAIELSSKFIAKRIPAIDFKCLGTPLDVRLFCDNYPIINKKNDIELYRYCFDLDLTLVTAPKIHGDYSTVEPIENMIKYVKYLKELGNTIIIYTARRMKTHQGNVGKVIMDIGKQTIDTLEKFNISYDELYFGKPHADYYIDDLAIPSYANLEKELGYYKSSIDTRSFNSLESDIIHTYTKSGTDLSGEIFWYNNIPNQISDLFPIYIKSESPNKYIMEKILGIPYSRVFLSSDMTVQDLQNIIDNINKIHYAQVKNTRQDLNIYQNYGEKIQTRYLDNINQYQIYEDNEKIYDLIYNNLHKYEQLDLGKLAVVHGDPVLTNILVTQHNKIKFIDMRGKIGDILTIFGDKFYDWAKLYQSLLGYDEILFGMNLSIDYKNIIVTYFESWFIETFGEEIFSYLKYLTASLLFSLIPLHQNEKCIKYYQLAKKILGMT